MPVSLCDTMTRIRTFQNIPLDEAVLQVRPFKITVYDLMTTLPPGTLSEKGTKRIKDLITTFRDGWSTDTIPGLNVHITVYDRQLKFAFCFSDY